MLEILISIKPKWCKLIASGKKTIEIRKTKPNMPTPFKVYIYETKSENGAGKVIGEFVCDVILPISIYYSDINSPVALKEFPCTGLTDKQIMDYLGNGKKGYGYHIANLKKYDKPKELSAYKMKKAPQSWCYVEVEE